MPLEVLKKRIKTVTDLKEIVTMMKMLSSVSISPYEKALYSLHSYQQTIDDGLLAVFLNMGLMAGKEKQTGKILAIVIGSDNGLVGGFNREIVRYAQQDIQRQGGSEKNTAYISIGKRIAMQLRNEQVKILAEYPIQNSLKEIGTTASMVLFKLDEILQHEQYEKVMVYYHHKPKLGAMVMEEKQLMPLPKEKIMGLRGKRWATSCFPMLSSKPQVVFSALVHEYLTVVLSMGLTASLAAEHYTRMVNMQQAEKNIEERLENMNLEYQQERQTNITEELIDIVSGAESLKSA